jgi:ubiquinone/menaquinone biosynthesis C-methylase UbiE
VGLYSKYLLPKLVHCACSSEANMAQRSKVVPKARGQVLEVGIGSGLNLPYYDSQQVEKIWGLDPSDELRRMAAREAEKVRLEVELLAERGEAIPLDANSIDTVVTTFTLCSIADAERALVSMARVLKPGGSLLFCEHGVAPDASVRRVQRGLNPIWKRVGGGCHLNRPIPRLIEENGFEITALKAKYMPGWRWASFQYWGVATPA